MNKDEAKAKIAELVIRYNNLSNKEKKDLNEAKTKQSFIEPLFKALGWDTSDYKETSMEENVPLIGRVDYALKINGVSRIYIEAKKLGADLNNPDYIKQAVTYAYSKGINWALLTNFAEIHLFNVNESRDKSPIRFSLEDYESEFDRLWLLSKDSISQDLLNKEAVKWGFVAQPIPIEERLFKQLRQWRETLFNQILHHNEWLKEENIDEIIQKLFNRLIFIRTAEDRKLEDPQLRSAIHYWESNGRKKDELKTRLNETFSYYRTHYDSELFEYHLLEDSRLCIYEDTIAEIINRLYDIPGTRACYNFNMIDADVLGQVYEQYLGYINKHIVEKAKQAQIRMSLGGTFDTDYKLVEKKQHRKEQGIYYTPKFVTDYIVRETIGRFISENRHDNYNKILNMKILDPACGSGSFLIRAYDELLNYHADVRGKKPSELPQADRMPILTGNIFGVDLDRQAVEIARLNLLLRGLASQGILKPLKDNIKQGNSLISGTDEELMGYFGDNWRDKHPFNWDYEFKDIMANGGFDIVIGNPPYGAEFDEYDRNYINDYYQHSKNNKNSAMVFIERALQLIKPGGYLGFIIPKSLAYSQKWVTGRKLILEDLGIAVDTSKAFRGVLLEQMVVVISKQFASEHSFYALNLDTNGITKQVYVTKETAQSTDTIPMGINEKELKIFNKMTSSKLFMKDISQTTRGIPFQKHLTNNATGIPTYRGDHISRYSLNKTKEFLPEAILSGADKKISFLSQPKILSQQIIAHVMKPYDHIVLMSTYDGKGILTLDTIQNTIITNKAFSYYFITGLLNSKLWAWYAYNFIFSKAIRTMHFDEYYLTKFPLAAIDFDNPSEKAMHDKLVSLVEKMLELNKKLAPIRDVFSNEKDELVKEIEKTDREIDELVYKLYGLTPEEIAIVEGKAK
ncbi:MAG: N-6 DNA methylase [Dehalococcoidales bacterium]|nr:N-6 DNA methylase [Dehalococcoidales bacterium]